MMIDKIMTTMRTRSTSSSSVRIRRDAFLGLCRDALLGKGAVAVRPVHFDGQNRLFGRSALAMNRIVAGLDAHAAVRTHALPVTEGFWYTPKSETAHFQRWKATP